MRQCGNEEESRGDVCVIGLGYIGFPSAVFLATAGYRVLGVDIQAKRVEAVNRCTLSVEEPGLVELFQAAVREGSLRAATEAGEADTFFICVPTPARRAAHYEGEEADLEAVHAAARSVAAVLRPGNLVVLESTVPPGTTEGSVRGILERSGLTVHRDGDGNRRDGTFHLTHCPERVIPGRVFHELVYNDRVVGGCSREAAERAAAVYRTFVRGDIELTDATTAEMTKLMENTFRDVNIALANEFAILCERLGIDVWKAIHLADRHPRVAIHRPGPGVGGHCIPVDPWFIAERAPEEAPLIRQARRVNDDMPRRVAARAGDLVMKNAGPGARVAVLGLAYKADVDDVRESPALEITGILLSRGIDVAAYDPYVSPSRCNDLPFPGLERRDEPTLGSGAPPSGDNGVLTCAASALEAAEGADLLLLLVAHREFANLVPETLRPLLRRPLVYDTCNAFDLAAWREAGFQVERLGVGNGVAADLTISAHRIPDGLAAATIENEDPVPFKPSPDGGSPGG